MFCQSCPANFTHDSVALHGANLPQTSSFHRVTVSPVRVPVRLHAVSPGYFVLSLNYYSFLDNIVGRDDEIPEASDWLMWLREPQKASCDWPGVALAPFLGLAVAAHRLR